MKPPRRLQRFLQEHCVYSSEMAAQEFLGCATLCRESQVLESIPAISHDWKGTSGGQGLYSAPYMGIVPILAEDLFNCVLHRQRLQASPVSPASLSTWPSSFADCHRFKQPRSQTESHPVTFFWSWMGNVGHLGKFHPRQLFPLEVIRYCGCPPLRTGQGGTIWPIGNHGLSYWAGTMLVGRGSC